MAQISWASEGWERPVKTFNGPYKAGGVYSERRPHSHSYRALLHRMEVHVADAGGRLAGSRER